MKVNLVKNMRYSTSLAGQTFPQNVWPARLVLHSDHSTPPIVEWQYQLVSVDHYPQYVIQQ